MEVLNVYRTGAPKTLHSARQYVVPSDAVAALLSDTPPTICFHSDREQDDRAQEDQPCYTTPYPIARAVSRAAALYYDAGKRSLCNYVTCLALLALSTWGLVVRFVMPEIVTVARVALIGQALVLAWRVGKIWARWRMLKDAGEKWPWAMWPFYCTFRVGAPANAYAPERTPYNPSNGLLLALFAMALSAMVIVPSQHVAVLGNGQLREAPASLYAGQWELYQVEWEGEVIVPLVDAGDDAVWVYVVTYAASAEPGAVEGDWIQWVAGTAQKLSGRVLNEMWQARNPADDIAEWRIGVAEAFSSTEMMAAFKEVITSEVEEGYDGKLEFVCVSVTCERLTVAQYQARR